MTETLDPPARHREHVRQRTESVRGKRGPVSFVWGNHVASLRQRVPGAPGLWSPLPDGEAGLQVEVFQGPHGNQGALAGQFIHVLHHQVAVVRV